MEELILANLTLFKELADKYKTYQNASIDFKRIIYFVMQLKDRDKAAKIIELLKRIDFLDSAKITYLLQSAYKQIDPEFLKKPLICPLGSIQDSSALICNKLIKTLFEDEKASLNYTSELSNLGPDLEKKHPSCIVFFDDNITSGTQLVQFFKELLEGDKDPEIVKEKLTSEQTEIFKQIPIRICFAIKLDSGCDAKVEEIRERYGLNLQILFGKADLNNHLDFGSSPFADRTEADATRELIMEISTQLYKNKSWNKETLYSRLLGYGNLGKVTVFYHNIPKSLIPIFWKYGTYKGYPWIPLFPENKEVLEMDKNEIEMDQDKLSLIDVWIAQGNEQRKPELKFGVLIDGTLNNEIVIEIPSQELFMSRYGRYFEIKELKAEEYNIPIGDQFYNTFNPVRDYADKSNSYRGRYLNYVDAVHNYNQAFADHINNVMTYILQYIAAKEFRFIVRNTGGKAASHVIIRFDYNSGEFIIGNFRDIPKPMLDMKKPDWKNFKPGAVTIISQSPLIDLSMVTGVKREPYIIGKNYEITKRWERIGHNDSGEMTLDIHRINGDKLEFELPFEINMDEQAETISGSLQIRFVPSDNWQPCNELDKGVKKMIEELKSGKDTC
ncbi:hypothetical protein [Chryseobacterium sp. 2987]|uniref:phosphoribosyltransferase-like protein n=1 Tax=Chryseobacterium sp. 2987 TaxID=2817767 RepID=UPI0028654B57|nr:hypothetical protein [Chryseobacterium sp. 2987]MDR6919528.1 hypothetical protein [Chryseobacterium sp. 2987]